MDRRKRKQQEVECNVKGQGLVSEMCNMQIYNVQRGKKEKHFLILKVFLLIPARLCLLVECQHPSTWIQVKNLQL